jgi:hypothetical protein
MDKLWLILGEDVGLRRGMRIARTAPGGPGSLVLRCVHAEARGVPTAAPINDV